jgi:alkylhydroperoxidase family enzyme
VIITASQTNECQFCVSSHCDLVAIADIVAEPLALVADPSGLVPRERLAVEFTQAAMHDSNAVPEPLMAAIHEQFSEAEVVELAFLVGYITMLNTFNNLLGVVYHGEYSLLAS